MLKKLTIKVRLIFVLGFLAVQLVIGALINIVSLKSANDEMQSMYKDRLLAVSYLDKVMQLSEQNQVLLARAVTAELKSIPALLKKVDENSLELTKQWDAYIGTKLTAEEKTLADTFTESRRKMLAEGFQPTIEALKANNLETATEFLHGSVTKLFAPIDESIDNLINIQKAEAAKQYLAAEARYVLVRNSCAASVVIGLLMALGMGVWLIRSIVRPLQSAVDITRGIAAGDLTQDIQESSEDETGQVLKALKDMNESLVHIVVGVRNGTDAIATASSEIAAGNHDLSSRTEQQAASLEETASSMEELTSTVKQNSDNARQGNQLATLAAEVAVKGGKAVGEVTSTMEQISASSKKISEIITVIDSIAFQTNILALNAAVEAARAGEQGRGFAVVASEVRNLAQRSAAAAKEIKGLITESTAKVQDGARQVHAAGATMNDIVASVKRVSDIMAEITSASAEQSSGIEQVNQAVLQMDQVTQQNAALVEEAAAAASSMQEEAGRLSQAVGAFKTNRA